MSRRPAGAGPRYWHGRFSSPAAYLAVRAIAARTRTDTSRVLLAVIAIAIGRATGVSPLTAKLIVGNRFRPASPRPSPAQPERRAPRGHRRHHCGRGGGARPPGRGLRREVRLLRPGAARRGLGPAGRRTRVPGPDQLPDQRPAGDHPAGGRRRAARRPGERRADPPPGRRDVPGLGRPAGPPARAGLHHRRGPAGDGPPPGHLRLRLLHRGAGGTAAARRGGGGGGGGARPAAPTRVVPGSAGG
ncbi:hypothetical protein V2I01_33750 [Micromonospora sp. BRA006-A]|nr:hypothetical protein [Micromonospora sp. BRA006-A]